MTRPGSIHALLSSLTVLSCPMPLSDFHALSLPLIQLSLSAVLKCGQSFRWSILSLPSGPITSHTEPTHEYRICLRDRVVCLRQSPDTLFYRAHFPDPQPSPTQLSLRNAETLVWLKDYFQLDVDLERLYQLWAQQDPVFARFQDRFSGIRILRQDPWENLVSFICSSNNNISRITKMVQSLCKHFSPPLLSLPIPGSPSEQTYHPFPPPSVLAQADVGTTLRSLGFGYRAEFIQRTAKMLIDEHPEEISYDYTNEPSERWLMTLRKKSTTEAREELLRFIGVGRKVADCILLMSLDKNEVIPVDTHVHQIAMKYYGVKGSSSGKSNMTPKLYGDVSTKLCGIWKEYAGWAHTVMFTADLKSFSAYGLPSPSKESPSKRHMMHPESVELKDLLPTPPLTPSPSPWKRKTTSYVDIKEETVQGTVENMSLAERVKKRRRLTSSKPN
ncbi:DNA glycosylase [Cyathus striatus]|nr:DNA glycosylase [Cyathus striatus]